MSGRRVDPRGAAVVLSLGGVSAAWIGTRWALDTADGASLVMNGEGPVHRSEFIEGWIYGLAALLGVLAVALAARFRWQVGLVGLAGVLAGLGWGAVECVHRYRESGWGGGVGAAVYVVPLLAAAVGGGLVLLRRR